MPKYRLWPLVYNFSVTLEGDLHREKFNTERSDDLFSPSVPQGLDSKAIYGVKLTLHIASVFQ